MRIKKDHSSWKARGILHRDFRHDSSAVPEVDRSKDKSKKAKPPRRKLDHKHAWVEIDYQEYLRYRDRQRWRYYFWSGDAEEWEAYTTYYACVECFDTKVKVDEGKRRAFNRKRFAQRQRDERERRQQEGGS